MSQSFTVRLYFFITCKELRVVETVELVLSLPFVPFVGLELLLTPDDGTDQYEVDIERVQWDTTEKLFDCKVSDFDWDSEAEFRESIDAHRQLGWKSKIDVLSSEES